MEASKNSLTKSSTNSANSFTKDEIYAGVPKSKFLDKYKKIRDYLTKNYVEKIHVKVADEDCANEFVELLRKLHIYAYYEIQNDDYIVIVKAFD